MSPAGVNHQLATMYRSMAALVQQYGVTQIAVEQPAYSQYDSALRAHIEKMAIVKLLCGIGNLKFGPLYNIKHIKKHATNDGRAEKRDMIRAANLFLGTSIVHDDNAADAAWILDMACRDIVPPKTAKQRKRAENRMAEKFAELPGQKHLFGRQPRKRRKR